VGPVERALRAKFSVPVPLSTLSKRKPFTFYAIDEDGIVLLLGQQEARTRLSWKCLESIPDFLREQADWVPAGGAHRVEGEPGTLDEYLKRYLKRDVARWLVRVLGDAGVVEVSKGPPLRLRLSSPSASVR
jgi:hypothetical protein